MSGESTTRLALVDDHNLVRKGLIALLNSLPGYTVVVEAPNGREFIDVLGADVRPDIAIIDLNMPVMDGFSTLRWMGQNRPEIKCIALTFDSSENAIIRAVHSGARGFLRKDVEPEEFKEALDEVRDTGYYDSALLKRAVLSSGRSTYESMRKKMISAITEREMQIIKLACAPQEYTYEQIADLLGLKAHTVEAHRRNLFDRFGIKSKAGLVIFAYRWGIVQV
jgi:DNA-binding NarL/FixJ family response regulator